MTTSHCYHNTLLLNKAELDNTSRAIREIRHHDISVNILTNNTHVYYTR